MFETYNTNLLRDNNMESIFHTRVQTKINKELSTFCIEVK